MCFQDKHMQMRRKGKLQRRPAILNLSSDGIIPTKAIKKFLEAVSDYCELPDSEYFDKNNLNKASVCHTAEMFNRRFYWYAAEKPLFEKLEQAFRDLLGALNTKM